MGKTSRIVVGIAAAFCLSACGANSDRAPAFSGTWKVDTENGITGSKETETIDVSVDNNMFRIASQNPEGKAVTVYDGETLYERLIAAPPASPDAGTPVEGAPPERAITNAP